MPIMSKDAWLRGTYVFARRRSDELAAVDNALERYHFQPDLDTATALQRAIVLWKLSKGTRTTGRDPGCLRTLVLQVDQELATLRQAQNAVQRLAQFPVQPGQQVGQAAQGAHVFSQGRPFVSQSPVNSHPSPPLPLSLPVNTQIATSSIHQDLQSRIPPPPSSAPPPMPSFVFRAPVAPPQLSRFGTEGLITEYSGGNAYCTLIQRESSTCGPACVAMVLRAMGFDHPTEEFVRNQCSGLLGGGLDETTSLQLDQMLNLFAAKMRLAYAAGSLLGTDPQEFFVPQVVTAATLDELIHLIRDNVTPWSPAIGCVEWHDPDTNQLNGKGHWVVLKEIVAAHGTQELIVLDPSYGLQRISLQISTVAISPSQNSNAPLDRLIPYRPQRTPQADTLRTRFRGGPSSAVIPSGRLGLDLIKTGVPRSAHAHPVAPPVLKNKMQLL